MTAPLDQFLNGRDTAVFHTPADVPAHELIVWYAILGGAGGTISDAASTTYALTGDSEVEVASAIRDTTLPSGTVITFSVRGLIGASFLAPGIVPGGGGGLAAVPYGFAAKTWSGGTIGSIDTAVSVHAKDLVVGMWAKNQATSGITPGATPSGWSLAGTYGGSNTGAALYYAQPSSDGVVTLTFGSSTGNGWLSVIAFKLARQGVSMLL